MIPAASIVSRVRTLHEAASSTRWDDAAIYAALNEGLDHLSIETRFYERYATLPIVGGRALYDLRGIGETALGIKSVWSTVRNDWVFPDTAEGIEAKVGRRWEQATGDPQVFYTRGIYWMGVWPVPDSTAGYLRIYYNGLAPHFTHGQSVISELPDDFLPALEEYALYELAAQDGETDRALAHWSSCDARVKQFKNIVSRRLQRPATLRIGGGL